jgi:hypothetical protein
VGIRGASIYNFELELFGEFRKPLASELFEYGAALAGG